MLNSQSPLSRLTRRALFALFAVLLGATPVVARAQSSPSAFVQDLGNQAITILQNQNLSRTDRRQQFDALFRKGFDVPTIARFVLGRYWRTASPDVQTRFVTVFREYVVAIYADRFSKYSGVRFIITGQQPIDNDTTTVTSEIDKPEGGPPIHVSWTIVKEPDGYKIVDVGVENLSMRTTERDEFESVISQNGGNVQALIGMLQQKIASAA